MSEAKVMELVFTSFRDSQSLDGLKVAIDYKPPKLCSYPVLNALVIPRVHNMERDNMEKLVKTILDNNWELVQDFITDMQSLGIRRIIFCDWITGEMISRGRFCAAGIIGDYIKNGDDMFQFPITIEYRDGRGAL